MSHLVHAVAITVSDACSRGERRDESGEVLVQLLEEFGADLAEVTIVSDDLEPLVQLLHNCAERSDVNLIITTGGTGLGPRDNTPEATLRVIEREVPGISEAIRAESRKITPMAMISRGVSGVLNGTLIINLPGSPKAVRESFEVIRPVLNHSIDLLLGNTSHK